MPARIDWLLVGASPPGLRKWSWPFPRHSRGMIFEQILGMKLQSENLLKYHSGSEPAEGPGALTEAWRVCPYE